MSSGVSVPPAGAEPSAARPANDDRPVAEIPTEELIGRLREICGRGADAKDAGLSPSLMAAANSCGGVLGEMISRQNPASYAAAVGMAGQEGRIVRKLIGWSALAARRDVRPRLSLVHAVLSWIVP